MRHAKSSWAEHGLTDFERPLNERGQRAAPLVGRLLQRQSVQPDLVVCSPAERARQTCALVLSAAQLAPAVRYEARVYEASAGRLLEVVNEIAEPAATVMVVGHNPGMEDLIRVLTGAQERMPTAAVACIAFDLDTWRAVTPQAGRLGWLVRPKELAGKLA